MKEYYEVFKDYFTGSIIDVGCEQGQFLDVLKDNGFDSLFGIDKLNENIVKIREKGYRGETMILENIHIFISRKFDTVCCLNVVDEFHNKHGLFRNLQWLMHEDSHLLIDTEFNHTVEHLKEIFDLVWYDGYKHYVFKRRKE